MAVWFVYVVRCRDGTLYTGISRDVAARLTKHNQGKGARYTRGRGPVALVHSERKSSQTAALRREADIKRLPRTEKLAPAGASKRCGACWWSLSLCWFLRVRVVRGQRLTQATACSSRPAPSRAGQPAAPTTSGRSKSGHCRHFASTAPRSRVPCTGVAWLPGGESRWLSI